MSVAHTRRHRAGPLRLLSTLVATALLLAACATTPMQRPTAPLTRLRVAMFPAGGTLPVHVGLKEGIFERNGLRIELTEATDLNALMTALTERRFDVVMTVPTLVLVGAEKQLDLQVVASVARSSRERPNAVWITRDSTIDSVGQLKGKTIGVPSRNGIIIDSMVYLLEASGIDRDDVTFVPTPFAQMSDRLAAGQVDAVVATAPFSALIAARGFKIHDDVIVEAVQDASDDAVNVAMTSLWASSHTFAQRNPGTISAWREALTETIDLLNDDESEARASMQEWLDIPASVIDQAPLPDWTVDISPDELAPYVTISNAVGSTNSAPDVWSLVWQGP